MKSKRILIIVLLVVIAIAAIYVFTRDDSVKNEYVFCSFGELTRDQLEIMQNPEISEDNIAVHAKDFVISFDYLENLTAQNELTGKNTDEARNIALNQLIVKCSLYYYAINEGHLIDEETIKKGVEENLEMMKSADNYCDFETFLDGLGMCEDEYWYEQFDLYKLNYIIDKFKEVKKEEFAKGEIKGQELNEKFSEYFMDIAEEAVSIQNIKLDESLNWSFSRENDYLIALCH